MIRYRNIVIFIIAFLLVIKEVNTTYPLELKMCLDACRTVFGVKGPQSDWNKYFECLSECYDKIVCD